MTRFDPSIVVRRMRIERGSRIAYDENFHTGLNIIRGENSSGKSTLLNFLFYGLGGDLADWSEVALLCSRVIVEVTINGKTATFSREISEENGQPMEIFGGSIGMALEAPRAEWIRYPYKRSATKESFSQAIFRLLQMPEVTSDVSGNVTIHQVLRLLYSDQLSPVENIFKFERFDPPLLRDAVGRLLCGAYDSRLYDNEIKLRGLNKEFDTVSGELRSLISVLGKSQENMTLEWIAGQRQILVARREALTKEISEAEKKFYSAQLDDKLTLSAQDAAHQKVQTLQEDIGNTNEMHHALSFSIADSADFIASLEQKLKALNDAGTIADFVGEIRFDYCPACFAQIGAKPSSDECHLCKTPFDRERAKARIVGLINDTALQIKQSRSLQVVREAELKKIEEKLAKLSKDWRIASEKFLELRELPSSEHQEALRALQRQAGYLDREMEDLENKVSIAQMVDQLSRRKAQLNGEISRLRDENEAFRASQQKRLTKAYTDIAGEIRTLLHNDLRRQDSFENAQSIQFDFASNTISVDGHSYFSASSRAFLKSSFFAGFLAAATKETFFRHPRFCIIDNIEDKGMEPVRSQNFQLQLARISEEARGDHQVIIATAMIVPDLDEETYTIGKFSTRDDYTLDIKD